MTIGNSLFPSRLKGLIVQMGYVNKNNKPKEWVFDCFNVIPFFEITETGEELYARYTIKELKEISQVH